MHRLFSENFATSPAPRVEQHVRDRPPHLPRRSQHVQVEPIPQHRPAPPPEPEHPLHRSRHPHSDRLHPAPEIESTRRLDDQVQVIPLHRPVHHPKAPALTPATPQRRLERPHESRRPQRRNPAPHLQRDMTRRRARERRPSPMRRPPQRGVSRRSRGSCVVRRGMGGRMNPCSDGCGHDAKRSFDAAHGNTMPLNKGLRWVGSRLYAARLGAEMMRASSRLVAPMTKRERTSRSRLTVLSPASIFATRD